MAASYTLTQQNISRKSPISKSGVLTIHGFGVRVRMQAGHLEIEDGVGPARRKIRLARVGHGLQRLVLIGSDGFITLDALHWLSAQDVAFSMLERDGSVLVTTGPVRTSDARLRRAQALAHSSGAALRIARELVRQKLAGQEQVARGKLLDASTAERIARFRAQLPTANSIGSIRLIESQAASAYWFVWHTLPINFPRNDLRRVPDHWRIFGARISPLSGSPRLAVNPPNAILNYLYAILESEARLAAAALGLDPGLGVLHVDAPNRDSLALDILEPVRPLVDSYLTDWITTQPLKREWFFEQRNGNARLMASLAEKLSETAPMWARAVAPVAEWVAQTIWSQRKKAGEQPLPTRLTQRRRSEGRGMEFILKTTPAPPPLKICPGCGTPTHEGRLCPACGREVSKEKLIGLAKQGRVVAQSPESRKKRSDTQRRHEAAKRQWRNSSGASSFDREKYVREIQPRLASVTIANIAATLGVCEPYAADIRSGRRRPHPRHWQALAGLVGLGTGLQGV